MAFGPDGDALFFSDLHLGPADPALLDAFSGFCEVHAARGYAAVYCLGDLFNHWVGPGHEQMPASRQALEAVGSFVRAGSRLVLAHGNRDFHLGEEALRVIGGGEVAPEAIFVRHHGVTMRLEHGDLLCTRDTSYRALRLVIRSRAIRRLFRALPLAWRLGIAGGLRGVSRREVARKSQETMGPNQRLLRARLTPKAPLLVIGHIHQARRRSLRRSDGAGVVLSLGSWDHGNRSWMELTSQGFVLYDGPGGDRRLLTPLDALRTPDLRRARRPRSAGARRQPRVVESPPRT
jgi:UDP-2,3-diacylglucosamine hydrolase